MNKISLKPYIFIVFSLFFGSILQGYFLTTQNPKIAQMIIKQLSLNLNFLKDINSFLLFLFIFLNNSLKTLISLTLGFFFGLVPIFFITTNGFIIGLIIYIVGHNVGFLKVILGLLPHGIFEISATILAQAIGLWLGIKFLKKLIKKEPFKKYFFWALKKYFKIILPLLLLAALIESFITPLLYKI